MIMTGNPQQHLLQRNTKGDKTPKTPDLTSEIGVEESHLGSGIEYQGDVTESHIQTIQEESLIFRKEHLNPLSIKHSCNPSISEVEEIIS